MKNIKIKYILVFVTMLFLGFLIFFSKGNIVDKKLDNVTNYTKQKENREFFTTKEDTDIKINESKKSSELSSRVETNLPITDKKILDRLLLNKEKETTEIKEDQFIHVLQIKPQIQEIWYYCAPTTVSMMLSSRGFGIDQYTLAKEMGTYEPYGTHNKDAIRILNKYMFGYEYPNDKQAGYRLETVTNVEQELPRFKNRLIQNIKDGYPMYYTFDVSKVYPGKHGEHNVIGIGYKLTENKNDIEYIYYLDPDPNVQDSVHKGLKIITPRELLSAMITCGEPNYAW